MPALPPLDLKSIAMAMDPHASTRHGTLITFLRTALVKADRANVKDAELVKGLTKFLKMELAYIGQLSIMRSVTNHDEWWLSASFKGEHDAYILRFSPKPDTSIETVLVTEPITGPPAPAARQRRRVARMDRDMEDDDEDVVVEEEDDEEEPRPRRAEPDDDIPF